MSNMDYSHKNKFTRSNINQTQNKIIRFIENFLEENGYSPTVRDICEGTGIKSTSTVHSHLKRLRQAGKITYDQGRRRAISMNSHHEGSGISSDGIIELPVLGTVAAGTPIFARENIETTIPFPADYIKGSQDVYMLKVRGDSMIEASILDGDHVIVRKQSGATPGDIVVALIYDEATVKTFVMKDGMPYLKPENPKYDLIPFYNDDCAIIGKVIGLFRSSI